MSRHLVAVASAALFFFVGAAGWSARAADSCVRVVMSEWNTETLSADPVGLVSLTDDYLARMIFDPFVDTDSTMQAIPALAESWVSSADGRVWTFRVRQGVTFHDGTPLTADDVIYSFRRLLDPAIGSAAAGEMAGIQPENIQAVDPQTVKVTLQSPIAELPSLLANHWGFVIKNGATKDDLRFHPVGTGPFTLSELKPGLLKLVFSRNAHYWGKGLPKSACIELSATSEPVSRTATILSGAADVVTYMDPSTISTIKAHPDITLSQSNGGTALSIHMFVDTPPFTDVRVRQAMKLVVDRQAMVNTALLGFGVPGNDNPILPSSPDAYRTDTIPRDVAQAKQLLAAAGYPNGITVDLHVADLYPGTMPMVYAYQQMAAEAGIKVNVLVGPASEYWDNVWLKQPFGVSNWAMRSTQAALAVGYRKKAGWNDSHFFRDDFDALLDKAAQTMDATARRKLYQDAQRMITEEGGEIIPMFSTTIAAMRKGCSGYTPPADLNRVSFANIKCE